MHDFDVDAERIKLERVLNIESGGLDFLTSAHSSQVRAFREDISNAMYQRHQSNYARLASLSRVIPTGASAKLAETVLGSVLGAGVAGEMDPERAIKLSSKLSPKFLAKLCIHLEPHRAARIVSKIPPVTIVEVAQELVRQEEYITLARFVTSISDNVLRDILSSIGSADALLRVGIFVEQRESLNTLLEFLSDQRRREILQAASDSDMLPQTLVLLTHLTDKMKGEMGDVLVSLGENRMQSVIDISRDHNLWEPLILAVANMQPQNRHKSLSLPALQDVNTVASLLKEIDAEQLWPLLAHLWLDAPEATLTCALNAMLDHSDWQINMLREMRAADRGAELKVLMSRVPDDLAKAFIESAKSHAADQSGAIAG